MPRSLNRLSPKTVESLSKPDKTTKTYKAGLYHDGGGLNLRVGATGACSWTYRFMFQGKARELGLGPFPEVTLTEARAKAEQCRRLKASGVDPLAERHRERAEQADSKTFRTCAELFMSAMQDGWKSSVHRKQWSRAMNTFVYPVIGDMPVSDIGTGDVVRVLVPLWSTRTATGKRLRGRIEMVLSWAKANGYRSGENPAAWKDNLQHTLPKPSHITGQQKHYAALPYGEIGAFMAALREKPGTGPRALEFCILSATRTTETRMARWEEFSDDLSIWTVPAERTKMKRELRVPLTDAERAILVQMREARAEGAEYVFPGKSGRDYLSEKALLRVMHRMNVPFSVHGFRSTFSDWCAETTAHPEAVREMALGHAIENRVEAAYRRGDLFEKRRMLMADWSNFCGTPRQGGTVVDIRRATA